MITVIDIALAALLEAGEGATAEAVRAVGANASGWPLPGLMGWLPEREIRVMSKAIVLAHRSLGSTDFTLTEEETIALTLELRSTICDRLDDQRRVVAGALAFTAAGGCLDHLPPLPGRSTGDG